MVAPIDEQLVLEVGGRVHVLARLALTATLFIGQLGGLAKLVSSD